MSLPSSFLEAFPRGTQVPWIGAHIQMREWGGGLPEHPHLEVVKQPFPGHHLFPALCERSFQKEAGSVPSCFFIFLKKQPEMQCRLLHTNYLAQCVLLDLHPLTKLWPAAGTQ